MPLTIPLISVVIGTRPEAIKLAPIVQDLLRHSSVKVRVCLTGQHRELLAQGLAGFNLPVDTNLEVMTDNQSGPEVTARILERLSRELEIYRPALMVVQGDTTTALAAALAGFQMRVPVAHVEAGLRSHDLEQPWPEEMNRRLISQMAALHFAPTEGARAHLLTEGIPESAVHVTGNSVIDALNDALSHLDENPDLVQSIAPLLKPDPKRLMAIVTVHRRENLGWRLKHIGEALEKLVSRGDTHLIFPAHPNPAILKLAEQLRSKGPNLTVIEPLEYFPFIALMQRADFILTDSGGIQEEASALGKPVLVLRDRTERPELLADGNGRLVGTEPGSIVDAAAALINDPGLRKTMTRRSNSFGDGHSARRITDLILAFIEKTRPADTTNPIATSPAVHI